MKTVILAIIVASLVLVAAHANAEPAPFDNGLVIQNSRDAPTTGQKVAMSADPEWFESPRGGSVKPLDVYEVTPDWDGRWRIFLNWTLLFLWYGMKSPVN